MRPTRLSFCAFAIAAAILLLPSWALAQTDLSAIAPGPKRVDVSGSGGFLLSTDWSDLVLLRSTSVVAGTVEQVLVRNLVVDPGPVFNVAVTYWEGRYGFRAHGGFARSCLAAGRSCGELATRGEIGNSVGVETWMYDVGGAVGLLDYRPGMWVWPYVFVGVGGVTYNLERTVGPPLTIIERVPPPGVERPILIAPDEPREVLFAIDELGVETRLALNLGVGTDFRIPVGPAGIGVRFELSNHIHRSPLGVRIWERAGASDEGRLDFGVVHNLRAAAGLVVRFGR
jgi:hypothetical protein